MSNKDFKAQANTAYGKAVSGKVIVLDDERDDEMVTVIGDGKPHKLQNLCDYESSYPGEKPRKYAKRLPHKPVKKTNNTTFDYASSYPGRKVQIPSYLKKGIDNDSIKFYYDKNAINEVKNDPDWIRFCDEYAHIMMGVAVGELSVSFLIDFVAFMDVDLDATLSVVADYQRILNGEH